MFKTLQSASTPESPHKTMHNQSAKNKDKNFEWRKRKRFLCILKILFNTINRFLRRNFADQQPMSYSPRADKPKIPAGSAMNSKTVWKKVKEIKPFPYKQKTKGMFLVLKLKGSGNMKVYERVNITDEST